MRRYERHVTVCETHLDAFAHVNNVVYVQFIEEVAIGHAAAVGFTLKRFKEAGAIPVVRRHTICYHRPAVLGDTLVVSTEITHCKGVRATRHNEVRREGDGALLVDSTSEWVWLEPIRLKPVRVPQAILEAFAWPP
jgi:acyl-CoA thioester hydrolase